MKQWLSPRSLTLTLAFTAFCFCAGSPAMAAEANPALSESAVVLQKPSAVIDQHARTYLQQAAGETVTVWVFFTDKGITSRAGFYQAASSISLTDRAQHRRAKVALDHPVFADLPVLPSYVQAVQTTGGTLRRTSRMLNAASFELPKDKLDAVAALPFVQSITPVAKFKKTYEPATDMRIEAPKLSQSPDALVYGSSYDQLQQITVPAMHAKGYNGQGVTLAIFDTGFRKTHEAFAKHYTESRVLAEHDFIFNDGNTANEGVDAASQWDHGTYIWSTSGGYKDGTIYGPAYKANFILCKTEDVRSETPVEEDNWIAALEWVDSIGADVITSSLGYSDWYTYADMNGTTAPISVAAGTAAGLGIVVCNSMGNAGPGAGTLSAPADAFNIVSCGAVSSTGSLASFSSRGPTYDGRMKPEVCARGISTFCATSASNTSYGSASGTSLSTPLIAGAACLLVQAHPTFTPLMIRQAMMETASQAGSPDNNYGWGIVNTDAAASWAVSFSANTTLGPAPLAVQFTDQSGIPATSRTWYFGDGDSSTAANPTHSYTQPGAYNVELKNQTAYGELSTIKNGYIIVTADTLRFASDSAFAGQQLVIRGLLTNTQPLSTIEIPFKISPTPLTINVDSIKTGSRTSYFEEAGLLSDDPATGQYLFKMTANTGGGSLPLAPGVGEVLRIYVTVDYYALGGLSNSVDTITIGGNVPRLSTAGVFYRPISIAGVAMSKNIKRSDLNRDAKLDLIDLSMLISYLTRFYPMPVTLQAGDFNADQFIDLSDLSGLIAYLTAGGNPPANP